MGVLDVLATVGKVALKGGKWALKHSDEIAHMAEAGKTVYDSISEISEKKRQAKTKEEYYSLVEQESENLKTVLQEIDGCISELQNAFETSVELLDNKCDATAAELETLKQDHSNAIGNLQSQLTQYQEENIAFQNQINKQFMRISIIGAIGIVIAILLAIIL